MEQEFEILNGILTAYHGPGGDVVIPENVHTVNLFAFRGNQTIESVTLPKTLNSVGDDVGNEGCNAFAGCTNLKAFFVHPENEYYVADGAALLFSWPDEKDYWLVSAPAASGTYKVPEKVKHIGSRAFDGCSGLERLEIHAHVKDIRCGAFLGCPNLREIVVDPANRNLVMQNGVLCSLRKDSCRVETILPVSGSYTLPETATHVSRYASVNCPELEELVIPAGLEKIEDSFSACKNLRSFVIDRENKIFSTQDGVLFGRIKKYSYEDKLYKTLICAPSVSGTYTVPKGVEMIAAGGFTDNTRLEKIVLPKSLKEIEHSHWFSAFSGCFNLRSFAVAPDNKDFFSPGDGPVLYKKRYDSAIVFCVPSASGEYTIPTEFEAEIDSYAFQNCRGLTRVTVPGNIHTVSYSAFFGCEDLKEIRICEGVRKLENHPAGDCPLTTGILLPNPCNVDLDDVPYCRMPEGILRTTEVFKDEYGYARWDEQFREYWRYDMTPEDWAWMYFYQTKSEYQSIVQDCLDKDFDKVFDALLNLLNGSKKSTLFVKAAEFAQEHSAQIAVEKIQALYEMTSKKKSLQKAADILKLVLDIPAKKTVDPNSPYAFLEEAFQEAQMLKHYQAYKGNERLIKEVKLTDGKPAPALVVLAAVVPYADCYSNPTSRNGYKETEIKFLPLADKAAAMLDHESLMALLYRNRQVLSGHPSWLLPCCRYANGNEMQALLQESGSWSNWYTYYKKGRDALEALDNAILLSETREALLYLDKKKPYLLKEWAELRGTDADSVRDEQLVDFGLDEAGKKVYDLGGNTVTVSLAADLSLTIFDENAQKAVKSLPKKDADPDKHAAAKADLAELKKNIKKVVKSRNDLLFKDFLSGRSRKGSDWQKSYLHNAVLRQVASILVWSQGGKTFTLKDGTPIDSSEAPCTLTGKPVRLAHPLEMSAEDVTAWQKYFTKYGLKQPFAQIWEPAIPESAVKPGRYEGVEVPLYRFKDKEKHGISFHYDYGCSELEINFSGCHLGLDCSKADFRHHLDIKDLVGLGKFTFESYTRQVNHIVAYLDQITIFGRIAKDDPSIGAVLEHATLAQITQYINYSIENQSVNATAVLLEYKNQHFPDFDPMDEFTLEDF